MFNIALNTFREIVRNRFLYLILFFAFVFLLFSLALGSLTIAESSDRVIIDFGLAMIEIFGLIGVLFVGSQLLFKEIEGKTIFLILSKPIRRQDFILGKFFGFAATLFCIIFLQSIVYIGVLLFQNIEMSFLILMSLIFTYLKLLILLAIVFFFSTFMSTIMTILVSLMIYLISHSFSLVLDIFLKMQESIIYQAVKIFQLLLPPMQALNIKNIIGSFQNFEMTYFLFNGVYAALYITLLLFFTVQIFSRKTFEN